MNRIGWSTYFPIDYGMGLKITSTGLTDWPQSQHKLFMSSLRQIWWVCFPLSIIVSCWSIRVRQMEQILQAHPIPRAPAQPMMAFCPSLEASGLFALHFSKTESRLLFLIWQTLIRRTWASRLFVGNCVRSYKTLYFNGIWYLKNVPANGSKCLNRIY